MSEDYNFPALADLDDAWRELEAAKELHAEADEKAKEALERAQDAVVTLALQLGDDANLQLEVLRYLYWMKPEIKVAWLAEAFGLKVHQVAQMAGKASLPLTCSRCGMEYSRVIGSRSQMHDALRDEGYTGSYTFNTCAACWEVISKERSAEAKRASETREARLWQLRTMPYREYLQTPEWQERRAQQLRRAHYRCQVCNASRMLNVHHRTYERRGNEEFRDLLVLCSDCHTLFHSQGKLAREE